MTSPENNTSATSGRTGSDAVTSRITRLPSCAGGSVAGTVRTGTVLSTVTMNAAEVKGCTEESPGVTVAVSETAPSVSLVVSTAMSYTGPAEPVTGAKVCAPPVNESSRTPESDWAET